MSAKDYEIIEFCWTKFWKTILESDRLVDSQDSLRKTLGDLITKASKDINQMVSLESLLEKKSTVAQIDQNMKNLMKFSMEVSHAVHQDCIKSLAFN